MNEEIIAKELQAFSTTDAAIAKLKQDYMVLTVSDLADQRQIDVVHEARMDVKKRRIAVTKKGEDLRSDAIKFQKAVIEEVKRIVGMLEPIETHLGMEEGKVAAEKARIKAEEEAKEAAQLQTRVDTICAFGATFNGQMYSAFGIQIPTAFVKVCTNEQFELCIAKLQMAKEAVETETRAKEEALKTETERQAKVAAEQEAERQRLAEISRKQIEEADRIKAGQEAIEKEKNRLADAEATRLKAIEDEKRRVEAEKLRAEELEKAREEAIGKALKDAKEKAERDAAIAADRVEKERIAAEQKAAREPDKIKLRGFADAHHSIVAPELKMQEARTILYEFLSGLSALIKLLREKAETL